MTRRNTARRNGIVVALTALAVLAVTSSRRRDTGSRTTAYAFSVHHPSRRRASSSSSTWRRPPHRTSSSVTTTRRMAIVGGGGRDKEDNDSSEDGEYDPLGEWIRRGGKEGGKTNDGGVGPGEEEDRAEGRRLPLSYYGAVSTDANGNPGGSFGPMSSSSSSSSSLSSAQPPTINPYLSMITQPSPSDLISRFTSTAPQRVQDAVRTTILGLIGGISSQMKFDTRAIATGERLANLMFQLQMTGYMFKNAEYRLGMSQSLGGSGGDGAGRRRMLPAGRGEQGEEGMKDAIRRGRLVDGGRIRVSYGGIAGGGGGVVEDDEYDGGERGVPSTESSSSIEVEVNARAYMSELRREVKQLRDELESSKLAREEELRKDLLAYIRSLPKDELQSLTGTMSPDVLDAMKGLVSAVLSGIGEGGEDEDDDVYDDDDDDIAAGGRGVVSGVMGTTDANSRIIGPDTVTEQSGEALAQLCMWQLVVGYNLRELEVREEFRISLSSSASSSDEVANDGKIRDDGGDSDYDGRDGWR